MDFTAMCMLNVDESVARVMIFRTGYPRPQNYMKTIYYKTPLFFNSYNTNEEIMMEGEGVFIEKPMFQPSKDEPPVFFKTWEEADNYAELWWLNNILSEGRSINDYI